MLFPLHFSALLSIWLGPAKPKTSSIKATTRSPFWCCPGLLHGFTHGKFTSVREQISSFQIKICILIQKIAKMGKNWQKRLVSVGNRVKMNDFSTDWGKKAIKKLKKIKKIKKNQKMQKNTTFAKKLKKRTKNENTKKKGTRLHPPPPLMYHHSMDT